MHTISSVLSTVKKRRLRVQNRSAGCVLSCTNTSTQQEVPSFCLRKQGISKTRFRVLHFSLNSAPQVFTCLRHRVAAYLHHQGISIIPYLDDWLIHHPDRQVLLRHQSQLLNILNRVGLRLNEAKSELEPVQDIKFLGLPLLFQSSGDMAHACRISSQKTLSYKCPNLWDHSVGPQVSSHWVIYT